jgi:Electron transfer DM13
MKGKLLFLGLAAVAMVGCTNNAAQKPGENSTDEGVKTVQVTETASPTKSPAATVVKSGSFVKGEHATTGKARIVTENGKNFLELDQNFKTDKGPDLFVILHREAKLPVSGIKEKDYVTLGALEKVSGAQRYAIPDNVKIADFASAAIWCRQFNATFGYATFSK